ncbi:MAG: hypothetical protein JOZ12_14835 [Sinobacteraceae bacterium]|nr:hypothetical protein [Nevskiaceae bacterium]
MRQALAMALQDYAGAVVLVSHDRHLLRSVSDEFLLVHKRRVQPFDGDLEDYARWLTSSAQDEKAPAAADAAVAATDVDIGRDSADARRQRKREEAERRNRLAPLRRRIEAYERELSELAQRLAEVDAALATPEIYAADCRERLRELLVRQGDMRRRTEQLEALWLEASEQFEAASAS